MTDREKADAATRPETDAGIPAPLTLDKDTVKDLDVPEQASPKGGSLINCQTRDMAR